MLLETVRLQPRENEIPRPENLSAQAYYYRITTIPGAAA